MSRLIRITLFVALGLLLAALLGMLADRLVPPESNYPGQVGQLLDRAASVDALVAGNSHGSSIDFETLGYDGFHLWRLGEDVFETDYVLRTLLPRLPEVEVVFIPISYYHFHWDKAALLSQSSERKEIYGALPAWRYLEGDFRDFVMAKVQALPGIGSVVREDSWDGVFFALVDLLQGSPIHTDDPVDFLAENMPDGYFECGHMTVEELINQVTTFEIPQHSAWQAEMEANHPGIERDTVEATRAIIEYLQARGVRVVFFTTPYFETYTALYDPETVDFMRQTMTQLAQDYGVEYYDFSDDPVFAGHAELFSDGNHLNLCGARQFSRKLGQQMDPPRSPQGGGWDDAAG